MGLCVCMHVCVWVHEAHATRSDTDPRGHGGWGPRTCPLSSPSHPHWPRSPAAPTAAPEGYWLAASGTGWSMYLSDNLSAIASPLAPAPAAPAVYGLDGRRVKSAAAPGVYVVNGEKRVVR